MNSKELIEAMKAGNTVVLNRNKDTEHPEALEYAIQAGLVAEVHRPPIYKTVKQIGLTFHQYGNKFSVKKYGRDQACDLYADYLQTRPDLLAGVKELKGKALVCWCAPLRCHAELLAELAERSDD
jgi:hypothetical protein